MRRVVRTPWFGDERVGFELSPRTWQGWGLELFVVAAVATSSWLDAPR